MKFKTGVIVLMFCIFYIPLLAQSQFEGLVKYRHTVEIKDTALLKNELNLWLQYGSKSVFYFKDGNYKIIYDGGHLEYELYKVADNLLYTRRNRSDTAFYQKMDQANELILEENIKLTKQVIAGKTCKLLTIKSKINKTGEVRGRAFYFSSDYRVNPSTFDRFKTHNTHLIYQRMQAIPLEIILLYKGYRVVYRAVEVVPQKIDPSIFEVKAPKILPLKIRP